MRKLLFALTISFFMAASCHAKALNITVTIFPVYDWVREITKGTDSDIKLLLDNGVDLHSYNPSVDDIVRISTCDVFIYVGGESDEWVKDALRNVTNKNQIVINLLDVLGNAVKEEEITEGMQHEHHHEHEQLEHGHEEEHHEQHEHEQHKHEYEKP
ncbi:MAG: zinc ABC transporter substrate-binding protein, partial [Synergistaceae bacterium]|nr:zinc ABC transporter substrate-binding protein [Synergistaceae bacterium]